MVQTFPMRLCTGIHRHIGPIHKCITCLAESPYMFAALDKQINLECTATICRHAQMLAEAYHMQTCAMDNDCSLWHKSLLWLKLLRMIAQEAILTCAISETATNAARAYIAKSNDAWDWFCMLTCQRIEMHHIGFANGTILKLEIGLPRMGIAIFRFSYFFL